MQNTEAVFKSIRNWANVNEGPDEIMNLFTHIENSIRFEEESICNGSWNTASSPKDLFHAVKFVLKNKCHDIIEIVPRGGNGFELFRLFVRRFDPVSPNLCPMLQAQMYGLANHKCKDFPVVIARVALIDRMANDQAEQCGSRPQDDVLADICFPSLGGLCLIELVLHRIDHFDIKMQQLLRTEPPARPKAAIAKESDNEGRPELHTSTASEVEEPTQQQQR